VSQQSPITPFEGGRVLRPVQGAQDTQASPAPAAGLSPSLTYEPYYGLKEKPFSLSADPKFLFKSPAHAPAFEELLNGIRRREGLITLTGEIGTGKTTLIRSVLQNLDRRTFSAFVPDPFVSREDLLKMLLVDFGVVSIADLKRGSLNGASRPDLSYPLYEFLDSLVPLQAFAVVIIDEAQNLPLHLLEEIRILSDLEAREKLLQVVLVGQPELRSHLKLPEMRQVDQRVSVRCELMPLGREGVSGYVAYRLGVASGGDTRVEFSDAAIDAIFQGSRGTPRLINLICDRALYRGHAARVGRIEPGFVWDAIADLGLDAKVVETAAPPTPAAARIAKKVSLPIQAVATAPAPAPPPVLPDFEPETELRRSTLGHVQPNRTWKLVTSAAVVAIIGVSGGVWYLDAQVGPVDISAIALPAAPKKIVPAVPSTAVPPEASPSPAAVRPATLSAVEPAAGDRFAILVASFESALRAQRLVEELTRDGYRARSVELDFGPPRGRLIQVLVGGYRTAADAEPDLTRMRALPGFADAQLERITSPVQP
jgi:general secretion pathway protein A